jgi:hypothetical protein
MDNPENTVDIQKQKQETNDIGKKIDEVMKDAIEGLQALWFETFLNTTKQFESKTYNPYNE